MNVLPVIMRELRVQARQPFTYRLRLFGVVSLLVAAGWFLSQVITEKDVGGPLFAVLHATLFCATLLLAIFGAVDCLSRERREGTLGLLLLTPLSPADVVMAKVIAHGVRVIMLLVAVVPVFAFPLLLGGVSWQQLASSLVLLFSAACLALGSVAVASAWCKRRSQALALALVLATIGLFALTLLVAAFLFPQLARRNTNYMFGSAFDYAWLVSVSYIGGSRSATSPQLATIAQGGVFALAWLLAGISLAALRIRRVWREEPPSARRQWVETKLTTPMIGLSFYRRWMRRLLERNPVGWLERRSWQGRLVMWTWLAIVITVSTSTLGDVTLVRAFQSLQQLLAWLLVLSLAGTVAGSFRRERESGVLELLLISPLSARRIIRGRLLGLWGQFLPAVGLFVLIWGYISRLMNYSDVPVEIAWFLLKFATIPVVGLYFSLRCRSFIVAFLMTLVIGIALPAVFERIVRVAHFVSGGSLFAAMESPFNGLTLGSWLVVQAFCLSLAAVAWWMTTLSLEYRLFDFERSSV